MPLRVLVTDGTRADCSEAISLIEGFNAESLLADRGYDTDEIIQTSFDKNMQVIIPPKASRKVQRKYDKHIYKFRHLVENAFLHLKQWRGIATRYAKRHQSFLAIVQIRCILLWAKVI